MKRNLMLVIVLAGIILAGKVTLTTNSKASAQGVPEFSQADIERATIGLSITPVPVNAGYGRTRFLVGLGSYLVNGVGGCNDCHTNPGHVEGGDPFRGQPQKINAANFLAGGVKFGPFTSRNITPDPKKNNLPAGLTMEQFIHVLRTGEDLQKLHTPISPLLQVMPWPVYSKMSERDMQAIYLYLSAIPHAEPGK